MHPNFILIGGLVLSLPHVVSVDCSREGIVIVQLSSGNAHTFEGQDAAALVRFFDPASAAPKSVAPDAEPQTTDADSQTTEPTEA